MFLKKVAYWEVEEMSCIHMYLSSLVGEIFGSLQDRFVSAALSSPVIEHTQPRFRSQRRHRARSSGPTGGPHILRGTIAGHSDDTSIYPPSTASLTFHDNGEDLHQEQDKMVSFDSLELDGEFGDLDFFQDTPMCSYRSQQPINYMCSLGLDFIYDILLADAQERKDILKYYTMSPNFLCEALERTSPPPVLYAKRLEYVDNRVQYAKISGWVEGSPSTCNLGWLEYGSPRVGVSGCYFEESSLQARGYVFWDSQRIQLPGFGKPYPKEVRAIFGRHDRESVESRLKGFSVPCSELRRIVEEF
ncbi:hypothetical protein DL764_001352 [Monosporascus ibericus]|uniref:Uncharacterized protein n=1 Tax=Monosporascus ibericus TaxID=155417 RepID=A0A4Q4TPV0_9PEZI|nr:hypothetical protein DL764_001352 [Monosporascus ibericus]